MTAREIALRRRQRRRGGRIGASGGRDAGARGGTRGRSMWLGSGLIAGLVLALVSSVAGGGALYAQSRYDAILSDVVPPEQLIDRYSRGGARIYDRNGTLLYQFVDELAGLRRPVALSELSPWVTKATISVEDPDFYDNIGVNVRGIARAGVENFAPFLGDGGELLSGSGGSSITQQLAKNVYIPREERAERSLDRKLKETVIALELTKRYSKDQILEWYLNSISYGGIYVGMEAASQGYFGKSARDLTLPEAALLAGIPQSPARYDPFGAHNIDAETGGLEDGSPAKARQAEVLHLMARRGAITEAEEQAALAEPLVFQPQRFDIEAPHFVIGRVADEIRKRYGDRALLDQGLEVTTTLDLNLQHAGERIVDEYVARYGVGAGAHNGALIALDPRNGQILTYVGSRDYFNDVLEGRNDNIMASNSPGSTIKPFGYMTAFMKGWGTGTAVLDTPVTIPSNGPAFSPRNPGTVGFLGPIRAEQALGNSLNVSAIKTIMFAGVQDTISTLKKVGYTTFEDPSRYGPALITGGSEINLLDHAMAYSVLATNGMMRGQDNIVTPKDDPDARKIEPVALLKVADGDGKVLYEFKQPHERRVVPAEYAYLVTSVLSDGQNFCITYGVCNPLALPNGYPSAAKTGTSEPFADSFAIGETWTMGYTPELVAGTWAGNANNAPISGIDSTTVSFRTWRDFMVEALAYLKKPPTNFTRPPGVVEREVCWPSGRLPTPACPEMNRYKSLYAAEQLTSGKALSDTWWQNVGIDTRTGDVAAPGTPAQFVRETPRLVMPPTEVAGWGGLSAWAARWGVSGYLGASAEASGTQLTIGTPGPNQRVGGEVSITGRAASTDFVRYSLEWGSGAQPSSWTPFGGRSTPTSGELAVWDTRLLPPGPYSLRFRLEDAKTGVHEFVLPVTVDQAAAVARPTESAVLITGPLQGASVSGAVAVTGVVASGRAGAQVRIDVGAGAQPTSWQPLLMRPAPVNGTLATWDTRSVANGPYTVRLVLIEPGAGERVTQVVVTVNNSVATTPLVPLVPVTPVTPAATASTTATAVAGP